MLIDDPYNETVRTYFENPNHAGDLQSDYSQALAADVAESGHGARLVLFAGITDGMITEMRFRAMACPHLIAAAEWLCGDRQSSPVSTLSSLDTKELMERLSVPAEKTGKILLLEDALKSLWEQHEHAA